MKEKGSVTNVFPSHDQNPSANTDNAMTVVNQRMGQVANRRKETKRV